MMRETSTKLHATPLVTTEVWAAFLQRRVMRLLLFHDSQLFRGQFRTFYTGTGLANHPLLQFYDRHIKLLALSEELLDDLLPRIFLQWSQLTEHALTQGEDPTRGRVDWQRTIERASSETPGQLPLRFVTRLRQQQHALPENLLAVAILLRHQQVVHEHLRIDQQEELLTSQERQLLVAIEDHLARELAKPQVQVLIEEAQRQDLASLVEQARGYLLPRANPYRDLLDWWEHFSALHIGSVTDAPRLSLTSRYEQREHMDLWLYELWIALELLTLLQEQKALMLDTLTLARDHLTFIFLWNESRYRFCYQRQGTMSAASDHHWAHIPAIHPSYCIERNSPVIVEYQGKRIWEEPAVVIDVAYAANMGETMQRLLGKMTVFTTETAIFISPFLVDPSSGTQTSAEVRYDQQRYAHRRQETRIELYKMTPDMPTWHLQERMLAILQHIVANLPQRPQPTCCGIMLDQESSNVSGSSLPAYDAVCPKPHIGPGVYDLVSRERHCLKDPRLCHVIGQAILPPQVKRVTNIAGLKQHIEHLRQYGERALKQAEKERDEEKAEQFRSLILQQIGEMIEQYARTRGDTGLQEKFLREGIFKDYWTQHAHCLEEETRNMLISGEYVWDEYQGSHLQDWAAPAIQYCRALEREIRRRFYIPEKANYKGQWTLGSIKSMYTDGNRENNPNWKTFIKRAETFQIKKDSLIQQFVDPMVVKEQISEPRNDLAHGQAIDKETARKLREAIMCGSGQDGLLLWVARNIGP